MHEHWMRQAILIGYTGYTAPNPMVGCVVVCDGKIIGEGYHKKFGEAHAEVNAINAVDDKTLLAKSTLYVNLEPCSHFGKTPPCADLIIQHKIPQVVIGCIDTNEKVRGKGIEKLQNAGIRVESGILEKECKELNKRFFCFQEKHRPYIILKWAQSDDGFIGKRNTQEPIKISNDYSHTLTHKWRSEEAAIMVGTNTALLDNPHLNIRYWKGKNPLRVLIDSKLKVKPSANIFSPEQNTLIYNSIKKATEQNKKYVKLDFNKNVVEQVVKNLYEQSILSVLIEGGAILLKSFIKNNLWDEARIFTSPNKLTDGINAPVLNQVDYTSENISGDELKIVINNRSK